MAYARVQQRSRCSRVSSRPVLEPAYQPTNQRRPCSLEERAGAAGGQARLQPVPTQHNTCLPPPVAPSKHLARTHARTHGAASAQPTPISRMCKQETSYKEMSSHEAPVSGTQASRRQSRLPSLNLLLSTQTFNHLKLSSHLSQRQPLSVILSSINISQQSQLMQISSKNAPVCSS